jgi:uncharacterized membrane protein YhaH (DUF805 family)
MALTVCSLVLDSGVTPPGSVVFPYFVAVQNGLTSALCTCLLVNGFVGFQLYEDGTALSVWLLRFASLGMFILSGAISLLTLKGWGGLSPDSTTGLFVVVYVINALCLVVYLTMQIILVVNTLHDRWPLWHIAFGIFFLVIGQVILYVFSASICESANHYLDGLFFATLCNLLSVMMVYKVSGNFLGFVSGKFDPTNFPSSTGTRSRRRTWNSPSASSRTTGKSKSFCPMKRTGELLFTTTRHRNMREACITTAIRLTGVRQTTSTLFFSIIGPPFAAFALSYVSHLHILVSQSSLNVLFSRATILIS